MPRELPSAEDALRILRLKRTRPIARPPPPAGRALRGYLKTLDAALEAKLAADLATAPEGKLKDALMALGRGVLARRGQ